MRTCLLPLLALAIGAAAQQNSIQNLNTAAQTSIPVQLKKTVRSDKARIGDAVRLEALEPVLLGDNVVLPRDAKLYGHVVDVSPWEQAGYSRLSIVVERAVWGKQEVRMRAFISGLGYRKEVGRTYADDRCMFLATQPDPAARLRDRDPLSRPQKPSADVGVGAPAECREAWMYGNRSYAQSRQWKQQGVRLVRHLGSGVTWLMSAEREVNLPGGSLLMLRNIPPGEGEVGQLRMPPPPTLKK